MSTVLTASSCRSGGQPNLFRMRFTMTLIFARALSRRVQSKVTLVLGSAEPGMGEINAADGLIRRFVGQIHADRPAKTVPLMASEASVFPHEVLAAGDELERA